MDEKQVPNEGITTSTDATFSVPFNRRQFIKLTSLGVSGAALGLSMPLTALANANNNTGKRPAKSRPFYRLYKPATGDHFYTTNQDEADYAVAHFGYKSEGIACYVYTSRKYKTVPFYRLYNPQNQFHFYTTNKDEADYAVAHYGYTLEGIACYVFNRKARYTIPLYRLYNPSRGDHFYTANKHEADYAITHLGYKSEGVACYVYPTNSQEEDDDYKKLYRLYKASNGDHFYTCNKHEADYAIAHYGYTSEGVACYVYLATTDCEEGTVQFYRLFKASDGHHFYTCNKDEADYAIAHYGYTSEGVACYVYPDNNHPDDTVALYRLYKASNDDHFYTCNKDEADYAVAHYGYTREGTACYVYKA